MNNSQSAWYYNGEMHHLLPKETHGMYLVRNQDNLPFNVLPVTLEDEWEEDWVTNMKNAFENGMIRVQKFNDIATITVDKFSEDRKNRIFEMFEKCPNYFERCDFIEVVTLDWEMKYSDYDDSENYETDNYVNGRNMYEVMIALD